MGSIEPSPEDRAIPVTTTSAKWRFPAIHPEGIKFAAIAGAVTLLSLLVWDVLFWPLAGLTLWVAAFFRDPIRTTPQGDGLIVAPADGLVLTVAPVPVPREMAAELGGGPLIRVSIFMSVFDVHINRTPIAGIVRQVVYISGKFLNADLDKASEDNERQHFVVEGHDGVKVGFTQIAGLVARRIVTFAKPGDLVAAGQRIGLIRFGSRVDVYLPGGFSAQVAPGQRTIAGETVLARPGGTPIRGLSQ